MKFKTLIVDDEPLARKLIGSHVTKIEGLEIAGEFGDAIQASNYLRNHTVDLIFLDIQMPEINGLQFIQTLKSPPLIIFVTAFRDFAPEAFELDAIDYLLKPVSFDRLLKAVNKFFERRSIGNAQTGVEQNGDTFIYIKADRKMHKVSTAEIVYIESLDEYVKVHSQSTILVSRENISTLEEKLTGNGFVRIHRSFLVSAKFVTAVSAEGVVANGKQLAFGRAYKLSALAALGVQVK